MPDLPESKYYNFDLESDMYSCANGDYRAKSIMTETTLAEEQFMMSTISDRTIQSGNEPVILTKYDSDGSTLCDHPSAASTTESQYVRDAGHSLPTPKYHASVGVNDQHEGANYDLLIKEELDQMDIDDVIEIDTDPHQKGIKPIIHSHFIQ